MTVLSNPSAIPSHAAVIVAFNLSLLTSPLAIVVVGGMLLAPLLILLVLPVLILRFSQAQEMAPEPDPDMPAARRPADPSPGADG